jgi:hypothetical protein
VAVSDGFREDLIADADIALYAAKHHGKNRTSVHPSLRLTWSVASRLCDMGLLDDAIREHLDLKRRRGADPAEIERAEREALGPVRREPMEPEPSELIDEAHPFDADHEQFEDGGWAEPHESEHGAAAAAGATYAEPEPRTEHGEEDPFGDEHDFEDEPASASGHYEDTAPPPHRAPSPAANQTGETVEYDVEEGFEEEHRSAKGSAPSAKPAGKRPDEDVLEETPEFLQDAPDHDRLWFEQRPPRDFDFDG